jgi:hypothetical protein
MAQFVCGDGTQQSRHTRPIVIVGRLDSIKENVGILPSPTFTEKRLPKN